MLTSRCGEPPQIPRRELLSPLHETCRSRLNSTFALSSAPQAILRATDTSVVITASDLVNVVGACSRTQLVPSFVLLRLLAVEDAVGPFGLSGRWMDAPTGSLACACLLAAVLLSARCVRCAPSPCAGKLLRQLLRQRKTAVTEGASGSSAIELEPEDDLGSDDEADETDGEAQRRAKELKPAIGKALAALRQYVCDALAPAAPIGFRRVSGMSRGVHAPRGVGVM